MNDPMKALREAVAKAARWLRKPPPVLRDMYRTGSRHSYRDEAKVLADELDAALAAMGGQGAKPEELVIGAARVCGGEWFRELTWRGVMFLAPLDEEEKARHALTMPLPPPPGGKVGG